MFYSNFLKKLVKTCERCNIALINWKTDIENVYIDKQNYWYNQFLKKYFIINKEFYEIRSTCGYCINKNCKKYMRSQ